MSCPEKHIFFLPYLPFPYMTVNKEVPRSGSILLLSCSLSTKRFLKFLITMIMRPALRLERNKVTALTSQQQAGQDSESDRITSGPQ